MTSAKLTTIRVGHSPDSDDAFMFYRGRGHHPGDSQALAALDRLRPGPGEQPLFLPDPVRQGHALPRFLMNAETITSVPGGSPAARSEPVGVIRGSVILSF